MYKAGKLLAKIYINNLESVARFYECQHWYFFQDLNLFNPVNKANETVLRWVWGSGQMSKL